MGISKINIFNLIVLLIACLHYFVIHAKAGNPVKQIIPFAAKATIKVDCMR
jgi:hypothetical protein